MNSENFTCAIVCDQIKGYCYPIKDDIKKCGCVYDAKYKTWNITKETDLVKLSEIINEFNDYNNELIQCALNGCTKLKKRSYKTCYQCRE